MLVQKRDYLHQKILKPFITAPVLSRLSGRLRELQNKEKIQLGNPKRARGYLRELFFTSLGWS